MMKKKKIFNIVRYNYKNYINWIILANRKFKLNEFLIYIKLKIKNSFNLDTYKKELGLTEQNIVENQNNWLFVNNSKALSANDKIGQSSYLKFVANSTLMVLCTGAVQKNLLQSSYTFENCEMNNFFANISSVINLKQKLNFNQNLTSTIIKIQLINLFSNILFVLYKFIYFIITFITVHLKLYQGYFCDEQKKKKIIF